MACMRVLGKRCIIAQWIPAPHSDCRTTSSTLAVPSDERAGQGVVKESSKTGIKIIPTQRG